MDLGQVLTLIYWLYTRRRNVRYINGYSGYEIRTLITNDICRQFMKDSKNIIKMIIS